VSITAPAVRRWIADYAAVIAEHREELVTLDRAIGDADHGTNMDRGFKKAVEKLEATEGDDIGALLKVVGMALISSVGGAAGPLYGTLFLQMGAATAGRSELDLDGWTAALAAGVKGVQSRGKAEPGEKTMLDALLPAVAALETDRASGDELAAALQHSAEAAAEGMRQTIPLEAHKGRASYLGPRSVGHQDPGATSSHLLIETAASAFTG
jgi:dihydroxyacetone kinase-like protein